MLQSFLTATGIYFILDGIKNWILSLNLTSIDYLSIINVCRLPIFLIFISSFVLLVFKNVDL